MPLLNYYSQTKMVASGLDKTAILHLAPFKLAEKMFALKRLKAKVEPCLNTSGRGQMNSVQEPRVNKTNIFGKIGAVFCGSSREIEQFKSGRSQGFKFAVRLNEQ